jgi:hypothetical protein
MADDKLLQTNAGAIKRVSHGGLRQLIHMAENGPMEGFPTGIFRETLGAPFVSSVIWWTDSGKTLKIMEKVITRDAAQNPTQIIWRAFLADGVTVAGAVTDVITYSGPFETNRTRTIS